MRDTEIVCLHSNANSPLSWRLEGSIDLSPRLLCADAGYLRTFDRRRFLSRLLGTKLLLPGRIFFLLVLPNGHFLPVLTHLTICDRISEPSLKKKCS
jgi:hypothetical protein